MDGVTHTLRGIADELFADRKHDFEELVRKLPIRKIVMASAGAAMIVILIEAWFDDLIELL